MKNTFFLVLILALAGCASSKPLQPSDAVRVKGYYRKDGSYVKPHYRSRPDAFTSNNYGANPIFNQ